MKDTGKFSSHWREVLIVGAVTISVLSVSMSSLVFRRSAGLNKQYIDISTIDPDFQQDGDGSFPSITVGNNSARNKTTPPFQNPTSEDSKQEELEKDTFQQPENQLDQSEDSEKETSTESSPEPASEEVVTEASPIQQANQQRSEPDQPENRAQEDPNEEGVPEELPIEVAPDPQPEVEPEPIPVVTTPVTVTPIIDEPIVTNSSSSLSYWIYPGDPACNTFEELQQYGEVEQVKPEFATVTNEGIIKTLTVEEAGCNAISSTNVEFYKSISNTQFITISASGEGFKALMRTQESRQVGIDTLVALVLQTDMTGIELDFEGFGAWSEDDYSGYLDFLNVLGNILHAEDKQLMIDAPAIYNSRIQDAFQFKYEDLEDLPVDIITVMAYDYQYDYGGGAPVTDDTFLVESINYAKEAIEDDNRLVIGVPSYGYGATRGSYDDIKIYTKAQLRNIFGNDRLNQATRIPNSQELIIEEGDQVYVFQDEISINHKISLVEAQGIFQISIWHLGGNPLVR